MTALSESEMVRLWELHTELEFATRDAVATVETMTADNYVNHVPVMTGGRGREELIEFYGRHFIPKMPADTSLRLLARTVGMDWMLPGIPPTHRKVEVPMVVVLQFEGGQNCLRADLLGSGDSTRPTGVAQTNGFSGRRR